MPLRIEAYEICPECKKEVKIMAFTPEDIYRNKSFIFMINNQEYCSLKCGVKATLRAMPGLKESVREALDEV